MKILTFTAPETPTLSAKTKQTLSAELRAFAEGELIVRAATLGATSWQGLTGVIENIVVPPGTVLVCGPATALSSPAAAAFVETLTARFPTTTCAAFVTDHTDAPATVVMQTDFFPVVTADAPPHTLAESLRGVERLRARLGAAVIKKPVLAKRKNEDTPPAKAKEPSRLMAALAKFRIAAVSVTCCGRELPNDAHLTRLLCLLKLAKGRPLPHGDIIRLGVSLSGLEKNDGFSVSDSFIAAQKLLQSFTPEPAVTTAILSHDKGNSTYSLHDPDNAIQIKKRPEVEKPPRPITFFDKPLRFERPEHHKVLETLLDHVETEVDLKGIIKSRVAPFGDLAPTALYREVRKIMRMLESLRPPKLPSIYLTREGTTYRLVDRAGDLKFAASPAPGG